MAQGDRLTVIIDLGGGYTRDETVEATIAGGTVEFDEVTDPLWMFLRERRRTPSAKGQVTAFGTEYVPDAGDGAIVREIRVRPSAVLAVIETPKAPR